MRFLGGEDGGTLIPCSCGSARQARARDPAGGEAEAGGLPIGGRAAQPGRIPPRKLRVGVRPSRGAWLRVVDSTGETEVGSQVPGEARTA